MIEQAGRNITGHFISAGLHITRRRMIMGEIFGPVLVAVILILIVGFAIRSMVKDKKNGKSLQCGGDCKKCKGCH